MLREWTRIAACITGISESLLVTMSCSDAGWPIVGCAVRATPF
jgi:hypothetical protein